MRLLPASAAILLLAAVVALVQAVVTRHGVGAFEYVASALLLVLLLRAALLAGRHARRG